ncbi:MAG: hypothetical protein JWO67_6834 [Streptosporangiaceae bacterium]|nr:hypothetical protein [Streptosporangiaceae bacterium]
MVHVGVLELLLEELGIGAGWGFVVGCGLRGCRAPPVVVDTAVDVEGHQAPEGEHQVGRQQVSLQVPFPHHGPSANRGVAVEAFDPGQEPVSEGRFVAAVPRERAVLIRCNAAFTTAPPGAGPPMGSGESASHIPTTTMSRPRLMIAALQLERQVEMAARRALRFAVTVEGSNIGPETLDQLRDEVARLAVAYPQRPLPALLGDLIELQDVAFRLLEGRQRPAEAAEMYLLAGAISGMLAKASHDLGDPRSAMTQARAAYVCADNASHDGLRAWTRGLQSMIAYWAGWPNDAVRYAQLGADPAARTTGTSSVWLPAQEARAWAILGDADKAENAISRASDARNQVQGDDLDALGGIMTFTRPRQLYYLADARVWLPGAEAQAEQAASEAITAYQDAEPAQRSFSDEAGARADQALARATCGDLEGAAEALRPVLDLPPDQRIGGVVSSVMRVHSALRTPEARTAPVSRDMQLEIEAYSQTPASAALPRGR